MNEHKISKLLELNENITLWECEKDNVFFEMLEIKSAAENRRMLERLLCDIRRLVDSNVSGIQKVIECGLAENGDECVAYINYERLEKYVSMTNENSNASQSAFKDILIALDGLKKINLTVHPVAPDYILVDNKGNAKLAFVGLFELFAGCGLLDEYYLPPLDDGMRPNFQDDIYSAVKSFEPFLTELDNEYSNVILEKALAPIRHERFSRYSEILELVDKIDCEPNFIHTLKIGMAPEKRGDFAPIFEEMNKKCYMMIEGELAKNEMKDITGHLSTENWNGRFFVKDDCIRIGSYGQGSHEKFDAINGNWFLADFSFSYDDNSTTFDSYSFFEKKFRTLNQLANLKKTKQESVKKWQTLPEKEKEFIEENAFRVRYSKAECRNAKAEFTLADNFTDWGKIKTLKNEDTMLYVDDVKIGKINNFRPNDKTLVIKDILCDDQEIPKEGELREDIRQKVSQFKKQVEACQKFVSGDVVNPIICGILANSDKASMPSNDKITEEQYENFKNKVFNSKLKTDDTQREAVLEALSYKPVYLIQGPPGTGKTTVIVELIRQLISRDKNVKILITSQSNFAVDNVLERIDEVNQKENENLLFMRLASESEDKDINVVDSIKPHTYNRKLKKWVTDTVAKSKVAFNKRFSDCHEILIRFYDEIDLGGSFDEFRKKLNDSKSGNFIKRLFEKARTIDDVKKVFDDKLGGDFMKFYKIQKDWFAFLSNAASDREENKSMLNYGSEYIDFLMAMMMQVNIIAATCVHIASSKYSKVNFKFDYVIMDESSKASAAEALVPINMGKNIILIGDHKQLPPVVTREDAVKQKIKDQLEDNGLDVEKEFGESLFEKLITSFEADVDKQKHIKMLDIQYRMPSQIGSLISEHFYDGKLKNPSKDIIPDFDKNKHHGLKFKKDTSIVFIDMSKFKDGCNDNGDKYKRQNQYNMRMIDNILAKLNVLYGGNARSENPYTIGIIAGYRGQVELLKQNINLSQYNNFVVTNDSGNKNNLIEINTVDKFQGAERDIIIYDVVRSDKGTANIGFLDDYRRINVAFSRAKRLLIVVGDGEYLLKRATLNPGGKFKEFKLKNIVQDLQEQNLIFNNLEEAL